MPITTKPRVMVDTCPIISVITHETDKNGVNRYSETMAILNAAQNGHIHIVMPTMVIAEFGSSEAEPPETFADAIRNWVHEPYIRVVDLTEEIALEAQKVMRSNALKPADAIILASALHTEVEVLYTYDQRHLTPLSNKFMNRAGVALPIELPSAFSGDLFA